MIETLLTQVVFYTFAGLLILSALMVILSANAVRSALFLVLAFFASAGLWLMLNAEFLALLLVIVYVGAVMTLFLFVVMMLNVEMTKLKAQFVRYLPLGLLVAALMIGLMILAIGHQHIGQATEMVVQPPEGYSSTKAIGNVLYTDYVFPFEVAGVLLLVAIIAAIALTLRGPQSRREQTVSDQMKASKANRLRVVSMPADKGE